MAIRYGDYKGHFVTRSGWNLDPPEVSYIMPVIFIFELRL